MSNLFASTNPGDLFVVRNVGNLIPPFFYADKDTSLAAAIEFAVTSLKVVDIVVCGHSQCGAMQALAQGIEHYPCPHVRSWLKYGEESIKRVRQSKMIDASLSEPNQISQENVLQQIENLKRYPLIKERLDKKITHSWMVV